VEGSFWENLENKLKRRGPDSLLLFSWSWDGICGAEEDGDFCCFATPPLLGKGVVSIKPRHLRLNFEKPQVYV
jgi:hypothetical protein